jgi:putative flippase GtrA
MLKAPVLDRLIRHRFVKFGTIGFSGTIVNLIVLYLNQEILFRNIYPIETRLNLSLAGAIFLATVNNFLWNRLWTWGDRRGKTKHGFFVQMGQYFLASWLAILIQFGLTNLFAQIIHYLMANIVAIIIAAIFTYIFNDIWTFSINKPGQSKQRAGL